MRKKITDLLKKMLLVFLCVVVFSGFLALITHFFEIPHEIVLELGFLFVAIFISVFSVGLFIVYALLAFIWFFFTTYEIDMMELYERYWKNNLVFSVVAAVIILIYMFLFTDLLEKLMSFQY